MIIRLVLALLIHLLVTVNGHITMTSPCPRYSKIGKNCPALPSGESIDYDLRSPIGTAENINMPFCHHEKPWASPAAKWTAGQSVTVTFDPDGKAHMGGNCQFSISYDGGKTYVLLFEKLKYCFFNGPSKTSVPEVTSYTFKLPKDLPASDKAIFAWTWSNASGNREFYMNCADVSISGTSKSYTARNITVVNYGPSTPKVGEFANDYNAPLKYYNTNQKYLTVTGDGKVTPGKKPAGDTSEDDNADSGDDSDGTENTESKPDKDDGNSDTDSKPDNEGGAPDSDPKPDNEGNAPDPDPAGDAMEDDADTASINGGDGEAADDLNEEQIPSNDNVPAGNVDGEEALTGSTITTGNANIDPMLAGMTSTPTIVITETPTALYTSIIGDDDKEEKHKHHGEMCCQNCCNCNGGYNGGWFPGMQNMGGNPQYGYYGPGYIIPNPGMNMGNNYYYANGNGGGQGMYPGGIQGGQNGYQPYNQGGYMQPPVTSSYMMFAPTPNGQLF